MDFFYLAALRRQPYQSIFKPGCAVAVVLGSALDVLPVLINTDQLLIPIFLRPISIIWHSECLSVGQAVVWVLWLAAAFVRR